MLCMHWAVSIQTCRRTHMSACSMCAFVWLIRIANQINQSKFACTCCGHAFGAAHVQRNAWLATASGAFRLAAIVCIQPFARCFHRQKHYVTDCRVVACECTSRVSADVRHRWRTLPSPMHNIRDEKLPVRENRFCIRRCCVAFIAIYFYFVFVYATACTVYVIVIVVVVFGGVVVFVTTASCSWFSVFFS